MIALVVESIKISMRNYQNIIYLREKNGDRYLPIRIDRWEPDIISNGLFGIISKRPETIDFVYSIIERLSIVLTSLVITELKNKNFYANACFESGEKKLEVECRPSDGLGLALRAGAKIFVAETVMAEAGIKITELDNNEMKTLWSSAWA